MNNEIVQFLKNLLRHLQGYLAELDFLDAI